MRLRRNVPFFIRIEIHDTGVDIPEDKIATLFNPLKHAKRKTGGTGLGLFSLAKRVEALRGHYGIERRTDGVQGSVFWFTIPYDPDAVNFAHAQGKTHIAVTPQCRSPYDGSPTNLAANLYRNDRNSGGGADTSGVGCYGANLETTGGGLPNHVDISAIKEESDNDKNPPMGVSQPPEPRIDWSSISSKRAKQKAGQKSEEEAATALQPSGAERGGGGRLHESDGNVLLSISNSSNTLSDDMRAGAAAASSAASTNSTTANNNNNNNNNGATASTGSTAYGSGTVVLSKVQSRTLGLTPPAIQIEASKGIPSTDSIRSVGQSDRGSSTIDNEQKGGNDSPSTSKAMKLAASSRDTAAGKHKHPRMDILLVDDSLTILKMMKMMFTRQGHRVEVAEHGLEMLQKINARQQMFRAQQQQQQQEQNNEIGGVDVAPTDPARNTAASSADTIDSGIYDLVLMDLQMPVMDGYQAVSELRELESTFNADLDAKLRELPARSTTTQQHQRQQSQATSKTGKSIDVEAEAKHLRSRRRHQLVIGMSANSDYETRKMIMAAGADAFLNKPVSVDKIYHELRTLHEQENKDESKLN